MTLTVLNCGYLPLVDCAPLIIAEELGFAREEGLSLNLVQQPSWSALRDMLALGHLDAAQMLSPMPVAMSLGLGGLDGAIDALMVLSMNGTVFGLATGIAERLEDVGFGAPLALSRQLAARGPRPLRVGVPFHYSMHHLLLRYWIAGIRGLEIEAVTVPPPRMTEALGEGRIDAFWVGEPWGSVAVQRGVGHLMMTGRDIWRSAPEKVLAARRDWIAERPAEVQSLMRATYHAQRWLDTAVNTPLAIEILARSEHLSLAPEFIDPAISGQIVARPDAPPEGVPGFVTFHKAAAHFPWRSQAAWIAAELGADSTGVLRAKSIFRSDLYRQVLGPIGADLPGASEKVEGALAHDTAVASSRGHMILARDAFFDGRTFDFA